MKILFVCTGNTCRSLVAELYLKNYIEQFRLNGIEVNSCGISASPFFRVPDIIKKILKKDNIEVRGHVATSVNEQLVNNADIILVMEKLHQSVLLSRYPWIKSKIYLLKEYIGDYNNGTEISDPIGQTEEMYEHCAEMIKECIKKLVNKLKL